jgi:hypothetical protein
MPELTKEWHIELLARGLDERELVELGRRALSSLLTRDVTLHERALVEQTRYNEIGLGEYDNRTRYEYGELGFDAIELCSTDAAGPSHFSTRYTVRYLGDAGVALAIGTNRSALYNEPALDLTATLAAPDEARLAAAFATLDAALEELVARELAAIRSAEQRPVLARRRAHLLLPADCRAPSQELPLRLLFLGPHKPSPRELEDRPTVDARPDTQGLSAVVARAAHVPGAWIQTLEGTLEEILANWEDSPEPSKTALFKRLYSGTVGGRHGTPFSALFIEEPIEEGDVGLLGKLLLIATDAHVVLVVMASDAVVESSAWRALHRRFESRFLLRATHGLEATAIQLLNAFDTYGFCADALSFGNTMAGRFVLARLAQYLMVLRRYRIGSWRDRASLEAGLGAWLTAQTSLDETIFTTQSASGCDVKPLREARLSVSEPERGQPFYRFDLDVTPHNEAPHAPQRLRCGGRLDLE